MERLRILVVDDESRMRKLVSDFLVKQEYEVLEAKDGEEALDIFFKQKDIALLILDVMMPKMDGWEVCREIRAYSKVPIIMLTAKGNEHDELQGFELGVDEYITKPFSLMALRARVENIRKRAHGYRKCLYEESGYRFDFEKLEFYADGQLFHLSASEQKLLKLLVMHPGQTLTREFLAENIWPDGMEYVDENALSVTVSRLRRKLDINGQSSPVHTVYGIGYTWKCAEV